MPDVHAGAGCAIGTTVIIKEKIVPNLVGMNIGSRMTTYVLRKKKIDPKKLDGFIRSSIPAGINIRQTPRPYTENISLGKLRCLPSVNMHRVVHNLKTVQKYTVYNRKAMAEAIISFSGLYIDNSFTTVHNYTDSSNKRTFDRKQK